MNAFKEQAQSLSDDGENLQLNFKLHEQCTYALIDLAICKISDIKCIVQSFSKKTAKNAMLDI